MGSEKRRRGIRGAICASENTRDAIYRATQVLLREIVRRNGFATGDVITAFFTMTPDLDAGEVEDAEVELDAEIDADAAPPDASGPNPACPCIRHHSCSRSGRSRRPGRSSRRRLRPGTDFPRCMRKP